MSATSQELYAAYEEHSKNLRTWLVAYGIGGPVLFLTTTGVLSALKASGHAALVATLFLAGVALQVLLAAVNKNVMWACYYSEHNPEVGEQKRFKVASWISEQFWIDCAIDIASLACFAVATVVVFRVLLAAT